ncbi:DUF2752 domain-containing protein [Pontibacter rugosus]|uniref:DUF2752 domain-containing protein n=1 Tax=Pontibacter rugosus TaxID=1745966 RepID=A0ABW3SIX7_9BACT
MAVSDPHQQHLFSFCPFSWVLENGCWGCGLGHAIGFLARGEWQASWQAHPLAGPAVLLLLWRCAKLLLFYRNHHHKSTIPHVYGKYTTPVTGPGVGRNDLRTVAGTKHDRK